MQWIFGARNCKKLWHGPFWNYILAVPRTVSWLDCFWNVMAQAQKPDLIFRRNGRVHLIRLGTSVQSTTGSRGVRISLSNAGYTMFRGSVKSTGYPLHSPVSPFSSPPVRHRVPSHFNWTLQSHCSPQKVARSDISGCMQTAQFHKEHVLGEKRWIFRTAFTKLTNIGKKS